MTGIEKITARIAADALAEAEAIRAEAESRCADIRADYDKKAQEHYWKLIRAGVRDCELRVQRLGRTADMEAKKQVLALKQEMVSLAFERAKALVRDMPEEAYIAFLARQAAQAARTGLEEVIFCQADKAGRGKKAVSKANELLHREGRPGKLTVSEETREITGGLILKDGDIETNCAVGTLADMYRDSLAAEVAAVLFA